MKRSDPVWRRRDVLQAAGIVALPGAGVGEASVSADGTTNEGGGGDAATTGYGTGGYGMGEYGRPTPPGSPIGNALAPPADLDGDGLYEDVDGDGTADVWDVLVYYRSREDDDIRRKTPYFDFDGDGVSGSLFDALALYEKYTGSSTDN